MAHTRAKKNFQHNFFRQPLECLTYMLDNSIACDVTLLVQGQEIQCHKVILAAHSTVFHGLFDKHPQLNCVTIDNVTHQIMNDIIRFCYLNKIDIEESHCLGYVHAAKIYDFHEISQLCSDQLNELTVTRDNMLHLLDLAIDFQCKSLISKCHQLFSKCTRYFLECDEFLQISHKALRSLMDCNEVTGCSEADMFLACRNWARAECRRQHIPVASGEDIRNVLGDVLQLICYKLLTVHDIKLLTNVLEPIDHAHLLQYLVLPEELKIDPDCVPVLKVGCRDEPRVFKGNNNKKPTAHNLPRIRCKKCHKPVDTDVGSEWVCCAECLTVNFCVPCTMDGCHHEHWHQLQVFGNRGVKPRCTLCGCRVRRVVSCSACADFIMCSSCQQAALHSHHQPSFVPKQEDTYFLLIGGLSGDNKALTSCLIYNLQGNNITEPEKLGLRILDLPEPRMYAAIVDTEDCLYLIGGRGNDYYNAYKSSLCLDKGDMQWKRIQDINQGRHSCTASILDGQILVVGGCVGRHRLASVEMYTVKTNLWKYLPNYPGGAVESAACCAWRGAYYVSGGFSRTGWTYSNAVTSVYRHKPDTGTWQKLPDLAKGRYGHTMTAVDDHLYVVGGTTNTIECYDEATNQFTTIVQMPCMLPRTNVVACEHSIIGIGCVCGEYMLGFDTQMNMVSTTNMQLKQMYQQTHVARITLL